MLCTQLLTSPIILELCAPHRVSAPRVARRGAARLGPAAPCCGAQETACKTDHVASVALPEVLLTALLRPARRMELLVTGEGFMVLQGGEHHREIRVKCMVCYS